MSFVPSSQLLVTPHYMEPGHILQYSQQSGAFEALAGRGPQVRIGSQDLYVYVRRFRINTAMSVSQAAPNNLPSVSIVPDYMQTPTYLLRVRAEYDHHDTAAAGQWGIALPQAMSLGMRQGHFQLLRNMCLYGNNGANGEGLLNTAGATAVNLPADSNGNTTVMTYDNGQMALFLLQQILNIKTRTFQLGQPSRVVVAGPQRILGYFEMVAIVQLTQFQRLGAGSATTAGTIEEIAKLNGDEIEFVYDDTLIGKGAGGNDAIVMVMPEVKKPNGSEPNTNEFAMLSPSIEGCALQYLDMAAPREIPTPIAGGAIDVVSELRATSGWGLRPEAITIASMQYQ